MNRKTARLVSVVFCAISLVSVQSVAHAGVISAEQFLDAMDRRATLHRIDAVLARSEVRAALERHGVDPAQTSARVAALSDQELVSLAENLDELPAGGSLLGTVGIVFVVLLILELVGVVDIFKKF